MHFWIGNKKANFAITVYNSQPPTLAGVMSTTFLRILALCLLPLSVQSTAMTTAGLDRYRATWVDNTSFASEALPSTNTAYE